MNLKNLNKGPVFPYPDYGGHYEYTHKPQGINCSDEVCPGSKERMSKIHEIMQRKVRIGSQDFMEEWGKIVYEMHSVIQEAVISMLDCSEMEANLWIDAHVNLNHVKYSEGSDGEKYLSIDPVFENKYEE